MDHGKLTDHNGKQVDFRNVILIMTTNAGAADMAKAAYGFHRTKREGDDQEAITRMFTPEFRNRLDATITFAHLSQEIIKQVVEKFVLQLEAQLGDRNVTIELSDEASRWLIANGYDELMGARPMARVIQEHIKKPLADEVLFGNLKNGGHVRVIVSKDEDGRDKLGFEFLEGPITPKPEKLPSGAAEAEAPLAAPAPAKARLGAEGAADQGVRRAAEQLTTQGRATRPAFAFCRPRMRALACASSGAVGQVMAHGRPPKLQLDRRRLLRRRPIGVDVGVLSGDQRHLCRHRRARARLRLEPLVAGALDRAGVGGAGAGDPGVRARHRRGAYRSGDRGQPDRRAAVAHGGDAAADAAPAGHAAARSAAADAFHLGQHVGGIAAPVAGAAARAPHGLLQRAVGRLHERGGRAPASSAITSPPSCRRCLPARCCSSRRWRSWCRPRATPAP